MPSIFAIASTLHTVSSESMTICLSSSTVIFWDLIFPTIIVSVIFVIVIVFKSLTDQNRHLQVGTIVIMDEDSSLASSTAVET